MPSRNPRRVGQQKTNKEFLSAIPMACADETAAVEFMERQRWGDEPSCPRCGVVGECYQMRSRKGGRNARFLWRCRACQQQYSVRTGTVMEESRIPLRHWCYAYWKACSSKKGVSALQIARETGLSYKSALFLLHRIRHAMAPYAADGKLSGTIEADTTFVGGKPRRHGPKETWKNHGKDHYKSRKTPVHATLERGGKVRAAQIPPADAENIHRELRDNVELSESSLRTDEAMVYRTIGREFAGGHETVNHSRGEYARGDASDNEAESFFALVKRGHYGTWHSYSKKHLHRYISEHAFRWNTRELDDGERVREAVQAGEGKRLRYQDQLSRK